MWGTAEYSKLEEKTVPRDADWEEGRMRRRPMSGCYFFMSSVDGESVQVTPFSELVSN